MPFTKIAAAGIATTGLVTLERLDVTSNLNTTGIVTATGGIKAPLLGTTSLVSIASTITATATDVFVYDTRKDSDGGAWRKRTQHTSWYNENLNTASRGSRRDFPAVAVLVLTSGALTIYDGDDPDMPMWMVFNTGSLGVWLGRTLSTKTSVFMLNGEVCVGGSYSSGHYEALIQINFIKETALHTDSNGRVVFSGNIYLRNTVNTYYTNTSLPTIVSLTAVNDVAMTVLPNAPIDPSTGLPVPTIAVATAGGVSVIKDDGNIWDIYTSGDIYDNTKYVKFIDDRIYYAAKGTEVVYSQLISSITSDLNFTDYNSATSGSVTRSIYPTMDHGGFSNSTYPVKVLGTNGGLGLLIEKNAIASAETGYSPSGFGIRPGLTFIAENINTYGSNTISIASTTSMVAYATTTYNTGWMHGDIKGAFLSGISTASVTGTELITNGTFDSNVTGWTANNSTNTWSSGTMQITRSGGGGQTTYQAFTTVAGQRYVATASVNSSGSRGDLYIINGTGWGGTQLGGTLGTFGQTLQLTVYFTATSTTTTLAFSIDNNNTSITVDNVSVRIEEPDRSVNNKGLAVYGTITKTAVATGADLVAYSGFSSSNLLIQPYNSTLDFGTGDFVVMVWVNTSVAGTIYAISRGIPQVASNPRWGIAGSTTQTIAFNINGSLVLDTGIFTNGTWQFVCFTRISGNIYSYIDGKFINSTANTTSLTNTSASLIIGNWVNGAYYYGGKLSLLRISTTTPSPDQILKIYNDEKALFQENSKAVLYGSSDAVTALAYDDTTRLLSVGTSSGRSDFQGLERINNTTTAVTTAISASNGLIAEQ